MGSIPENRVWNPATVNFRFARNNGILLSDTHKQTHRTEYRRLLETRKRRREEEESVYTPQRNPSAVTVMTSSTNFSRTDREARCGLIQSVLNNAPHCLPYYRRVFIAVLAVSIFLLRTFRFSLHKKGLRL